MKWNLYENGKFLPPLKFSNGKTQGDVANEVLESIKKGHKIIFIHGVCGTGKCLDGNSRVFCIPKGEKNYSYYKIKDLVNNKGKILSLDNKGSFIESNFKNVRKTGKKELFKLKTRTGREILVSKNHPFLTITEKGTEWLSLEELNDSSFVCLPNKINLNKSAKIKDEEIKILAHLIAEGKLGDKAGSPKYYQSKNQNPQVRQDYINALKSLFPEGEIREKSKYEISIVFKNMDTTKGTTNRLRLLIKKYGLDGKKSKEKFVPKEIFGLEKEKVALFLSRLFSCDGSIYKKNSGQIIIEYDSISKNLIQDVSILLQRFGIQHTISSKKFRENNNYSWRICISNQANLKKYIQEIGFIGRNQKHAWDVLKKLKEHKFTNIDKIPRIIRNYLRNKGYNFAELDRLLNYDEINSNRKYKNFKEIIKDKLIETPCVFKQSKIDFLRSHLFNINKKIKDDEIAKICNKNIYWDKIKSIEFFKEDETYDLEVSKFNNFISDGMIVHNSAIALNIAKELGKTSIVVPIKNLQMQYKKDYESNKYLLKENNEKLKISIITGRKNHKCKFLEDNQNAIPKIKKEINTKLHNIFSVKKEKAGELIGEDISADNVNIPCKIEIKEKNIQRLKEYLKQNEDVHAKDFSKIQDVRRISVAGACPYWCPVISSIYELGGKSFANAKKRKYIGLKNIEFVFYQRKPGCKFYEQFHSYIDSDVIVFNSEKYKVESLLNRKPLTEVEIIDECDEFLDKFSNQKNINMDRLQNSLNNILGADEESERTLNEIKEIVKQIKRDLRIENSINSQEIISLRQTGIYDLFKILLKNPGFLDWIDDESYLLDVEESAKMFEDFLEESYVTFTKKDEALIASIVTTNLAKRFKEMADKNKIIVLMSGTLHSEKVLKEIFGIKDFKIIEAEVQQQGQINVKRTGLEMDCKYSNFSNGKNNRKDYLIALDKCIEISKKPILIHVQSFMDLPSKSEKMEFKLNNLMDREKLKEIQTKDSKGKLIEEFKKGNENVLFSTRATRGLDFPGEECNSIAFTKYPNPNVKDAFWRILNKTNPMQYWSFYKDKAKRELLQKIYRGLRFKEDKIELLSPDSRVLECF